MLLEKSPVFFAANKVFFYYIAWIYLFSKDGFFRARRILPDFWSGADIEEIHGKPDDELFRFALSRKEYEAVNESENPCAAFAEFWTKKESYLKLTGEGLSDNLKNVLSQEILDEYIFETTANLEKGYVFTICRKR